MRLTGRRQPGPARGPVAAYAAVLDGRHLWLALDAGSDGELALRDPRGELLPLDGEITDLTALLPPTDVEATYDVVVTATRLLPAKQVWAPPFPDGVTRTPPAPDGRSVLALERTGDGHLQVRRRPLAPAAELVAIDVRGDRVHLRVRPPGGVRPGCHLLMLDTDDQPLDNLPVTAHDGLVEALVGVDDLPPGYFGMLRLGVGTEESWVRIRRRANDLADPNHAVLLPELHAEGADLDRPRARFRWNPDALLAIRCIDPDEPDQARP